MESAARRVGGIASSEKNATPALMSISRSSLTCARTRLAICHQPRGGICWGSRAWLPGVCDSLGGRVRVSSVMCPEIPADGGDATRLRRSIRVRGRLSRGRALLTRCVGHPALQRLDDERPEIPGRDDPVDGPHRERALDAVDAVELGGDLTEPLRAHGRERLVQPGAQTLPAAA